MFAYTMVVYTSCIVFFALLDLHPTLNSQLCNLYNYLCLHIYDTTVFKCCSWAVCQFVIRSNYFMKRSNSGYKTVTKKIC